jgi:hypothetical protein
MRDPGPKKGASKGMVERDLLVKLTQSRFMKPLFVSLFSIHN